MKVLLTTLNSKYVHTNIALKYLYETIKKENEVILKEFTINEPTEKILRSIILESADVIAFSVYIWNVEEILKLAKNLKKIMPQTKIILGGPEVSYRSKELLEENASIDYIINGEGETVLPKLIRYLASEENIILEHVSYRESNTNIIEGNIAVTCDTNDIPRIASAIAENYDERIVYIETVRGCPYNCSYCLSSTVKGIRPFDMERVKSELLILMDAKIELIKFVDRTFNYDKKRTLEIWKFILEHNICSTFHFEISAHLIDDEMLDFLSTVPKGVFKFEIGVQSTNEDTIKAINRTTDFETIRKVTTKIMSFENITTHLDLIAGLPYEGYERFKQSFDEVYTLHPTELQLGFLKLLSGCEITAQKDKFEYEYTSYPPYEVLCNKFIKYEELADLKLVEEMVDVYYNSCRYKESLHFIEEKFDTPFEFYFELAKYASENRILRTKN